jgi:cytochrome c biogenesis protein
MSAGISVLARDLQGTAIVYDTKGQLVGSLRTGMSLGVEGVQLHLDELIGSTGLQIKADPGVPLVYAGFAGLMLGVMMSYISHSQVWGLLEEGKLYVGGRTNRSLILFEREFMTVVETFSSGGSLRIQDSSKQPLGTISPQ